MNAVSSISTSDDDVPSPATAWDYRRRARQIRCRYRNNPAALHLSLKNLATQVDAARPCSALSSQRFQHVKTRVVPARLIARTQDVADVVARENDDAAQMVARQTATIAAGLQSPVGVVGEFSTRVRETLGEGILRFDQRKALYRDATDLGIDRFEASLIIAAIEHRHGMTRRSPPRGRTSRGRPVIAIVAGILLIEALILTITRALVF